MGRRASRPLTRAPDRDRLLTVNLNNAFAVRTNEPEAEGALWNRHFMTGLQGLASWPRVAPELQRRKYCRGERCRNGAGTNVLRSVLASWLTQPGK